MRARLAHALRRDRSRGRRRDAHQHRRQGRALRRRQAANKQPAAPTTVSRSTASAAYSPISPHTAGIQATTALNEKYLFTLHTRPTPIQSRAFELLAINPDRTQ